MVAGVPSKQGRVQTEAVRDAPLLLRVAVRITRKLKRRRGASRLMVLLLSIESVLLIVLRLTLWRWRKPSKLVEADVLGFKMQLSVRDFVDSALLFFPEVYEWREVAFMEERLRPGDAFLDAGAHIGFYSLIASRAVGQEGVVIAVEADPAIYERLCSSLQSNRIGNVRALNLGVSDSSGVFRFGIVGAPYRAASSFLLASREGVDVRCEPVLDILQANGVKSLKGAKLDIEGLEFRVLSRFLKEADTSLHPEFIIVETNPHLTKQSGGDTLALLQEHSYQLYMKTWLNYVLVRDACDRAKT